MGALLYEALAFSCSTLASAEVRILYFFAGCPHFCEKALELKQKNKTKTCLRPLNLLFTAALILYSRVLQLSDTSWVSLSEPSCPS